VYKKTNIRERRRTLTITHTHTRTHTNNEVQCKLTDTVQLKATESTKLKGKKQYNGLNKMLEEKERFKICGKMKIIPVMQKNVNDVASTN